MAQTDVGIADSLDEILEALNAAGLGFSVVEPDGLAHGWMTTERHVNPDGSVSLWFGLSQYEGQFRFAAPDGQVFDIYGGDQRMLRLDTEQEVKAFLLAYLLCFTGLDVRETENAVRTMAEQDPYRRAAELHKLGWCPIWNDWEHYFTEQGRQGLSAPQPEEYDCHE